MGMWTGVKNIHIQDNSQPLFQYFLMQEIKTDILLTSPVAIDDFILNVSAGHGFIVGEFIVLWENNVFEQARVINVNVNQITIDIPSANAFSVNAKIIRGDISMDVNGSITPIDFIFKPYNTVYLINICAAIITMQHGINVPDDGKFGGIPQLTNGLYFRQANGKRINLGSYKNNADFRQRGAKVDYSQKAPAGSYGTNIDFTLNDRSRFGQVICIDPMDNDYIFARVRDNLTGLDDMNISLLGNIQIGVN